jgi:hypothetical protein
VITQKEKNENVINMILDHLMYDCYTEYDREEFWADYETWYYDEFFTLDQLDELKDMVLKRIQLKSLN